MRSRIGDRSQLLRYGVVGVTQNAANVGCFALLEALGSGYAAAAITAGALAFALSFLLHRGWTFAIGGSDGFSRHLLRYSTVFGLAVATGLLLLAAQVELLGIEPVVGQVVAILVVAPASYLVLRSWTFR